MHGLVARWPVADGRPSPQPHRRAGGRQPGAIPARDEEPGAAHHLRRSPVRRHVPTTFAICSTDRWRARSAACTSCRSSIPSTAPTPASTRSTTPRSIRGSAPGTTCGARAHARGDGRRDRQPRLVAARRSSWTSDARGEAVAVRRPMFLTYDARLPGRRDARRTCWRIYRPAPGSAVHAIPDWRTADAGTAVDHVHRAADRHRRPPPAGSGATCDASWTQLAAAGVRLIRLDAVGYAVKKRRHHLLHDPGDVRLHRRVRRPRAARCGIEVLVEVHSHYRAADRNRPPGRLGLRLRAAAAGPARPLHRRRVRHWPLDRDPAAATRSPSWTRTTASASSTSVRTSRPARRGSAPGLLTAEQIDELVDGIHAHSRRQSPTGHRRRGLQPGPVPGQLHLLRRARRRRPSYLRRAGHSVLPARNAAGLLRRAAGRRQRHGPARTHRRRAATSTGTTSRRTTCSGSSAGRSSSGRWRS